MGFRSTFMKSLISILILGLLIYSCASISDSELSSRADSYDQDAIASDSVAQNDTVRITNDSLEYEIIIIDPGYASFLYSKAKPEGYYSKAYLQNKNQFLVADYNQRVRAPLRYDSSIYEQEINYDSQIDYGYQVNYKLYNYFVYLSHRYGERFSVSTRL